MKKLSITLLCIVLILMQVVAVAALTSGEAKQKWLDAKTASKEKQALHQEAKLAYAANKSAENNHAVVGTGKDVLNAALDEAEAWLNWKKAETEENTIISADLKNSILADVQANLNKITALRADVDSIQNQLGLGLVFLKMIGKYGELVADVARNSGKVFVEVGNSELSKAENYEAKMRTAAETMPNKDLIIQKLDAAKAELSEARTNVANANNKYNEVVLPGTPLIKFSEGNNYIRTARANLLSAQANLNAAYLLMLGGQ
jgi:hypothetical protein